MSMPMLRVDMDMDTLEDQEAKAIKNHRRKLLLPQQ